MKNLTTTNTFIKFIQNCLERNGGNYAQIKHRMYTISEFFKALPIEQYKSEFACFQTAYQDFFVNSEGMKDIVYSEEKNCALYTKGNKGKSSLLTSFNLKKKTYGVSVNVDENANAPILYFGARKCLVDNEVHDSEILFENNKVCFHYEGGTSYEEIPLFGGGAYGEFTFDAQDRLTTVVLKIMENPRLGIWGNPHYIDFDCGYFKIADDYSDNYAIQSTRRIK